MIVSRLARTADTVVCVPTYNEVGTIGILLDGLLRLSRPLDILVIDDGSTDGTGAEVLSRMTAGSPVYLIQRNAKLGIGSAHRLAWQEARRRGYARIVTMDADLSHDPADVPRLLSQLDAGADVAIGSRFASGGQVDYRGWRLLLSRTANFFARHTLGLRLTEYTTSLRAARLDRVPATLLESNAHEGYSFFLTCIVQLAREGLCITEVPIHFHDRQAGVSKLSKVDIFQAAVALLKLAVPLRSLRKHNSRPSVT